MLTAFVFRLTQLMFIKSAMGQLATFRPRGKSVAQVNTMITATKEARDDYLERHTALQLSQGQVRTAHTEGRKAASKVYGLMKAVYGDDATSLQMIVRIPKATHSPGRTLLRMQKTSKAWAKLPPPPASSSSTSGTFTANEMTKPMFDELMDKLEAKQGGCTDCDQELQTAKGNLTEIDTVNKTFIAAALKFGRAQFPAETAGRALIDAIPRKRAGQPPGGASIPVAESDEAGSAHLEFEAERATTFQVWHKGPGEAKLALVDEVIAPGKYDVSGLAGGAHQYQVVGVNSRGKGAASPVVNVPVAAAQAA